MIISMCEKQQLHDPVRGARAPFPREQSRLRD